MLPGHAVEPASYRAPIVVSPHATDGTIEEIDGQNLSIVVYVDLKGETV
jgi:hypothetical protein